VPALVKLLGHDDPRVAEAATLSLLCLRSPAAADHCRKLCRGALGPGSSAPFFLALAGQLGDLNLILRGGLRALPGREQIEAAGILGNVQAVPVLLQVLTAPEEPLRVAAGQALEMLTGAGLRETAVVVEQTDLLGGEVAEERTEVERVATSPEAWLAWWGRHGSRFDPRRRWRRGKPFDPGQCVAELADGRSRFQDRQRAYWELEILSGQDVPFEPDWFVPRQDGAIEQWQAWWQRNRPS
jgi:hypothetical protein